MATWQFRKLNPNETSGTSTSEDNFAQEERTNVDILVRECIQNPLDARIPGERVEVHFVWRTISRTKTAFGRTLLTPALEKQLQLGKVLVDGTISDEIPVLVIEDFGTIGLIGTYTDSTVEGEGQNWNAFWFREGEGVKPTKANGGAGQGKLTMYVASRMRIVAALTTRLSDKKRLLFGSCRFRRNYVVDTERYAREARFGSTDDPNKLCEPIIDATSLDQYEKDLGIFRGDRPGTTFLIPQPDPTITVDAIAIAVMNEFYFPILRGRLTVYVNGREYSKATIANHAAAIEEKLRTTPEFRKFVTTICEKHLDEQIPKLTESWGQNTKILAEHFLPEHLEAARSTFANGEITCAAFPIRVSSIAHGARIGHVKVFAQTGETVSETDEIFIRQDLAIDKEKSLRSAKRLVPARALTLIDDDVLSAYLAAAEEPTHREWNGSRPKLAEQYSDVSKPLRLVRHAASRLVEFLAPPPIRDSVALASFFPDLAADEAPNKGRATKTKPKPDGPTDPIVDVKPPRKRPLEMTPLDDGAIIRVINSSAESAQFPITCKLELAYATEFGNAYDQWDSADFFLSLKQHVARSHKVSELTPAGNSLAFTIDGPESMLVIGGFDLKRQLEMRLTYQETSNAGDQ
jgi:hypothetical protein